MLCAQQCAKFLKWEASMKKAKHSSSRKRVTASTLNAKVPVPDVPSGKWDSMLYAATTKTVRMTTISKLVSGEYNYADCWRDLDRRKNYLNALDWIQMALNVETWEQVTYMTQYDVLYVHEYYIQQFIVRDIIMYTIYFQKQTNNMTTNNSTFQYTKIHDIIKHNNTTNNDYLIYIHIFL